MPLSRHQGPTIPYHPPLLGPIPLLRVPSSPYSLLLTASLYDPVSRVASPLRVAGWVFWTGEMTNSLPGPSEADPLPVRPVAPAPVHYSR